MPTNRVIFIPVGDRPRVEHVPAEMRPGLDEMEKLLECRSFGHVALEKNVSLFVDEDGLSKNLPPNIVVFGEMLHGPALIVKHDMASGDQVDFTDEEIERWMWGGFL